jgi:hypothetical protein
MDGYIPTILSMEVGMEATEFRPLTIGELLDCTFRLYRNHFWLFVGIMAIPAAFVVPFTFVVFSFQSPAMPGGKPSPTFALVAMLVAVAFFCLYGFVYSVAIGATTYAVSETYLGQKVTVRGSYVKVRGNLWRILGVVVVAWLRAMGMLVLGGIAMAIVIGVIGAVMAAIGRGQTRPIAGIIFGLLFGLAYLTGIVFWVLWSLRYAVSIPALLLERLGVLAALRRSVQLTRGRRWPMLVAVVLCTIIGYVGAIIFQGPFFMAMMFSARTGHLPDWLTFALAMSGAIGGAMTGPVLLIVLVLCYYDTRIRKEAFDLQFMMSSLDRPAPAPDTPSPA